MQQAFEKTLKAWLQHLSVKPPHSHDIARLLPLMMQAGVDVGELLPLRGFTTFAVQGRYDNETEELGLDRVAGCQRAEALIEHVQGMLARLLRSNEYGVLAKASIDPWMGTFS